VDLAGIFGPVVSTFDAGSGELDLAAFDANVRAHVAAGLAGIVVAGSTGEAVLLDEDERAQLVDRARTAVPSDRLLIVGAGGESTRNTIRRCRAAGAAGADAVLVVSPHYYTAAMTADAILGHFRRVADESPIPVILYNIPKYVGFTISPAIVTELSTHGNIVGIKDSSGDRDLMSVYINTQGRNFAVLTGSGSLLHTALHAGARGAILAVALFAPELSRAVYAAVTANDASAAAAAQLRLAPMASTIVGTLGVAGVKAALDVVGLHGGPVRAPLRPLSQADLAQVGSLLAKDSPAASP
jgi:dihydrodipicolinate synthase/N-acetylneuraminate lyase